MKLTRRSLFASIGLLFTDPRKLLANSVKPKPVFSMRSMQELLRISMANNARRTWEDDFNCNGKKIGDGIMVRMPMRFHMMKESQERFDAMNLQIERRREEQEARLRGNNS